MAISEPVSSAHFDARGFPDAHAGRDFTALDAISEFLREEHCEGDIPWPTDGCSIISFSDARGAQPSAATQWSCRDVCENPPQRFATNVRFDWSSASAARSSCRRPFNSATCWVNSLSLSACSLMVARCCWTSLSSMGANSSYLTP
jgi:hypothetical protein